MERCVLALYVWRVSPGVTHDPGNYEWQTWYLNVLPCSQELFLTQA
jgi:hypothetical protein